MSHWSNRYTDPPEHRVWINPHPLRNGVNRYTVAMGGDGLHDFIRYDLAEKYRWWVIEREHKRIAAHGARRGEGAKLPRR